MEKPSLSKSITLVFEKLEKLSKMQRILIFFGTLLLIIGVFGYFMYFPKMQQIQKLGSEYKELEKKLSADKNIAKNLPKLQEEMDNAESQLKIVMKALPETKEIPTLLEGISLSGQEAGLEFVLFQPGIEQDKSFYAEIPVSIQISGKYHNVAIFFDKVARLPRIVNIQDINMKPDPAKKNNELFTTCTAVTYKFLDAKAAAPADKAKKGAETKKKPKQSLVSMDKHLIQVNIAIGILCLVQLVVGCGDKKEPPQKAVAVSKKIVAKSNAVSAPVQVPAVEAEKQVVSSQQPAAPVPGDTPAADKAKQGSAGQAEKRIKGVAPTGVQSGVPSPSEQVIASVSKTEILIMQPGGMIGYNPEGKIDPFAPGTPSGSEKLDKEKRIPRTPLEMVDLGQLKLVAIMHAKSGNKALVEEVSGKGYIVAKGTYMGMNSGRVVKILKDSIIVEEEAENIMGKRIIQEIELKLQKPLGEE